MPITPFLAGQAFDPEIIETMSAAFVAACDALHLKVGDDPAALDDIFDLQDQITASVVGAIEPRLQQAEIERAGRKPTELECLRLLLARDGQLPSLHERQPLGSQATFPACDGARCQLRLCLRDGGMVRSPQQDKRLVA